MRVASSVRELRDMLDQLAEVDWRHPAWWGLVVSTAALERCPAPRDPARAYITSNGGPRADTFMGWSASPSTGAELVAKGLARARAAARALSVLDGRYPEQPLQVQLDTRGSLARRRPARPWRVVFATPTGAFVADLDPRGGDDVALATALARACVERASSPLLRPVDPAASAPIGAAIAVSLLAEESATARHLHRRGWNAGGGPWLGLGQAGSLDLVTTSHTVVDGFGHGEIAARVQAAEAAEHDLCLAAARRILGAAAPAPAPALDVAEPLGIAVRTVAPVCFAELAYATAATLERYYRRAWTVAARRTARFTPTFQVPVAPGPRDDPDRLRRRVVPGLVSVRMKDGSLESLGSFRARLPELIAREAAMAGVLTRVRAAAVRAPVPERLVRRWLAAGVAPRPWLPPVDVLAGRGCVSCLRYQVPPPVPIFAVSAPALDPGPGDPRGGTVLTAIDTAAGMALAVSGTGLAGTAAGAEIFLDQLAGDLEALSFTRSRADTPRGRC